DAEASINVATKEKVAPKANVIPEANDVTLKPMIFCLKSYQMVAESQASLVNAFDNFDMSSKNDSSAMLSEHD
ncbi:32213_t:CDS:2, partial [Gigaspora margarita]